MPSKPQQIVQRLNDKVQQVSQNFRLYDIGSYALNRFIATEYFELLPNIAYGLKGRQRLDLYRSCMPRPYRPLLVFVHGGSWQHGDKKDYKFIAEAFCREGYDVAVVNYHLAPEHIFPAYIDDLTLALNHLHQHQHKYQISTENLVLMGHSAGAFNVMSALYHPEPYSLHCREQIKAVVGIAGPYHFDYKGDPLSQHAFDEHIPYQQVMPYYFVDQNPVHHYLLMAANDQIVQESNSWDLHQVLQEKGNHSQVAVIPNTGHITIVGSLSSWFSRYFKTKETILQMLEQTFAQR